MLIVLDFNSRAHVERDQAEKAYKELTKISTHALTWSATNGYIT